MKSFFKNINNWQDFVDFIKSGKMPDDIPVSADRQYKGRGWVSWGEFLGNGRIADKNKKLLNYKDAKKFIKPLKIKGDKGWIQYKNSKNFPINLPKAPRHYYKDKGWISMKDFLGND